jgi:hemoglobin/transferrin/lactoferrin receptor protein
MVDRLRCRRVVAIALVFCLDPALLKAADNEGSAPEELLVVGENGAASTRGRIISEEPDPISVLDQQALLGRAPSVLTEALREEPAVHIQATTTGQGSPYIRGLTGSAVLNLVDGMRLNHAIYRSSPNPYLALVDPYVVDQMTIVRGPQSVRYGSDGMGGVIEVISRRPKFDSDEWEFGGAFSARASSADEGLGGRAEIVGGKSGAGGRLGLTYFNANDLRSGSERQVPTAYDWFGVDAGFTFEFAPKNLSSLDFQYVRQPETPRYDQLVAGYGQDEPSSAVWNYEPLERLFVRAGHEVEDIATGVVDRLQFDFAYQHIQDGRRTRDLGSPVETREQNESELFGLLVRGTSLVSERLILEWGADAYQDEVGSSRRATNLLDDTSSLVPSRYPDGSTMDSYGIHLHAGYELVPTVKLTGGLRYSSFDIDVAATELTDRTQLDIDDVTAAVGVVWAVRPDVLLLTNFRNGFRAPNIFDLGTLGERPGNRFNIPSDDLDPEKLYSADLGVRLLGDRGQGELFAFYSDYEDKIESVFTGDTTPGGQDVVQSANVNEVTILGVEASGSYELRPDWLLQANLTWTWGEEQGPDGEMQPADRIPPLSGLLALRYDRNQRLWMEPFIRYAVKQDRLSNRDIRDPRIDPTGTDGWVTLNLRLGWRWSDRLFGTFALENITDKSYREHGSGLDAAGLNAIVSLQTNFGATSD